MFFITRCFCHLRAARSAIGYISVVNHNNYIPVLARVFHLKTILHTNSDLVRVIDESGTNLGLMTKAEAEQLAEQKQFLLTEIVKAAATTNSKNPNSVFKFVPSNPETANHSKKYGHNTVNNNDSKKQSPTKKELTMKSQIDENDLNVKSKKLQQFLDKGYHVTIKISKPKRATRFPRETYELLVSRLQGEVKMAGGAKESDRFFRCTVVKAGGGVK